MLIKIIDNVELESHLEDLKKFTGSGSASKAVAIAASHFISDKKELEFLGQKIYDLEYKLNEIISLLSQKQAIDEDINSFLEFKEEML